MEERDDRPFELGTASSRDGVGAECLPDDVLTNVGGDEQRDSRAEAVSLLQKLVEADDDDAGAEELEDDQAGVDRPEVANVAVHAAHHVGDGLSDRDQHSEELLSTI